MVRTEGAQCISIPCFCFGFVRETVFLGTELKQSTMIQLKLPKPFQPYQHLSDFYRRHQIVTSDFILERVIHLWSALTK